MYNVEHKKTESTKRAVLRKGLRCQICTGCGLCPGITPAGSSSGGVHVLAEDVLSDVSASFQGSRRLVTADVGTTTIAMLLYAKDGSVADRYVAVNPQTVYGADVLARIRAAENPEAAADMREKVLRILGEGLKRFSELLENRETMYLVLAANTTMTYLLMGWDPAELGKAPFHVSHRSGTETEICGVPCYVFPGLSAFVGGDIVAGIYACGMCEREELTLLLDLGTNGEIVLGNRGRRIACATAAGPAFEGGVNRGVWGSDMISLLARLRQEEILDETGLLSEPYFKHGIRIGNVTVTQEAVRSVQLAKGAIAAGIDLLLDRYGANPKAVGRVVLAGGFGYYLRPEAAASIGLLPESLTGKVIMGGNTALSGAFMAGQCILGDGGFEGLREHLAETVLRTEVLNLAEDSKFQQHFFRLMDLK